MDDFIGTWRTEFYCEGEELIKIPNDIPVEYAAGISSNPCTAYRLLTDFGGLQKGKSSIASKKYVVNGMGR